MGKAKIFLQNWMDFVDTRNLKECIGGRNVYLWDDNQQEYIIPFLKDAGISVKGILQGQEEVTDANSYIIIVKRHRESALMIKLNDSNLHEDLDYTYIGSSKTICTVAGYYKDSCGNEIISEGYVENIQVKFEGYNNKLFIGNNFECMGVCKIKLKGNATLKIGRDFYCGSGQMYLRNSYSEFEGDSYIASNYFISNFEGYMKIGKYMSVTDSLYICVVEKTKLLIGQDCLVAKDVRILSGGAHSLFDLDLKENINIRENVHVTIGDHVWIGMSSKIIYNTDIGDNCIIGADSLVKGEYPSNCLLAGNIATVKRTNVDWDHKDYMNYEEYEEMKNR